MDKDFQGEIRMQVAVLLSRAICLYQVTRNADGRVDPVSSLSRSILEGVGELKRWTDYCVITGPGADATATGEKRTRGFHNESMQAASGDGDNRYHGIEKRLNCAADESTQAASGDERVNTDET